jgi:excisionase family DNA binding protein
MGAPLRNTRYIANRLGITEQTVRDWARLGKLPCVRLSRRKLLFDEAAVDQAVQQAAAPATPAVAMV